MKADTERVEGVVLVLIVLTVGGLAGAASFTHVHDWTMANSPTGTGDWFGWANAAISELLPLAALLTIRRRRRTGGPVGYPLFLLVCAVALSLAAQLAVAQPEPVRVAAVRRPRSGVPGPVQARLLHHRHPCRLGAGGRRHVGR